MNIYEEIKVILVRNGKSMSKVLKKMKAEGHKVPFPSNLSKMFLSGSIRFRKSRKSPGDKDSAS